MDYDASSQTGSAKIETCALQSKNEQNVYNAEFLHLGLHCQCIILHSLLMHADFTVFMTF